MKSLWGIDLGGTKIEGVILEGNSTNKVLFRERVPTEANLGYDHVLGQIEGLVNLMKIKSGLQPGRLGICTPGSWDEKHQYLRGSNTVCLNGKPVLNDLVDILNVEIRIANDANCFALAETKMGAASDLPQIPEVVFGVILGTGVGGGVVINGDIVTGRHGISGEWGHNFLDVRGGKCYCGRVGCVETILSGPALESYYYKLSGVKKDLKTISESTDMDPDAALVIKRLVDYFGKAISVVVNIIDPDVIILGGGVGNIAALEKHAAGSAARFIFNSEFNTLITKPKLGDSAGVFGAAFL
jgi:predicted NBD/HSP70 family sugar kinase